MRNRILCLVLAICMVVLAVPAFVLPMTAASTEAFKTVFGKAEDSWPMSDGKQLLGYPTPWVAGYFNAQGEYKTYHGIDGGFNILNMNGADQWGVGGIYLDNQRYILTGNTNPFDFELVCTGCATKYGPTDLVDGKCPKYHAEEDQNQCYKEEPVVNQHGKPTGEMKKVYGDGVVEAYENTTRIAFVMNYVSPYEGTADLRFETLVTIADQAESMDFFLAVFINGDMIWPKADGEFGKSEDWAVIYDATIAEAAGKTPLEQFNAMDLSTLTDVAVKRGDNIQFAIARRGANYCYAEPSVAFDAGYLIVPTAMTNELTFGGTDWPRVTNASGVRSFKQTSAVWQFGDVDANGNFVPFENYFRKGAEAYACHGGQDYATNGAIMLASGTPDLRGGAVFGTDATYNLAYQYAAVATGKVTPSINNMKILAENEDSGDIEVATSGSVSVKIYKNGELVDTVVATATADGVTAEWPTLDVIRGDEVLYVLVPSADVAAVGGSPAATYSEVDSFLTEAVEDKYALKLENGTAIFGDTFGVTFYTYATADVYNDYREAGIYVWNNSIAAADRTPANAEKIAATLNNSFAFEANYNTLTAKEMADVVAVQAYVVVNDGTNTQTVLSEVYEKSVADYVLEQYNATDDSALQKVLVAMLNYGAYAQQFFNYNTDNLANAGISESLRGTDADALYYASFDAQKGSTNNICNTEISAFSLVVNNSIDLKVYINIDPTEAGDGFKKQLQWAEDKADLGNVKVDIKDNSPIFVIEDIGLTELSKTFYFRVTVRYGPTLFYGYVFSYSVESYVARMVDSTEPGLADLVRSMMEFSHAMAAYNA